MNDKRIVMVFGAFDGLHPGHVDFFKQAKRLGDFLTVSVGTDKNVERIKGKKPLFNQNERLELVGELKVVDDAVLGAKDDFFEHIAEYAPDVVCLGYDQWASVGEVRKGLDKIGLEKTTIYRLNAHEPNRAKSSIAKKKSVDF